MCCGITIGGTHDAERLPAHCCCSSDSAAQPETGFRSKWTMPVPLCLAAHTHCSRLSTCPFADGAAAAGAAGGTSAGADPSTRVTGEQHAAAGSGDHRIAAPADPADAAPAQPPSQAANAGVTREPAAAVMVEPADAPPDAVPLATDDGLLAIGGFDELLASPSQPQPQPPALQGDLHGGPPQPEAPSDENPEQDVPNPPVSTEVSRAQQEKTAAAVADEMEHKEHQ